MAESFGEFLRRKREELDMTIVDLSLKSKVSIAQLSRLETGKRKNPKNETLQNLANALNVPFSEMMEKAGYLSGLDEKEKEELGQAVNTASGFVDDAIKYFMGLISDSIIDRKPYYDKIEKDLWHVMDVIVTKFGIEINLKVNALDPKRFIKIADSICRNETIEFKNELVEMLKSLAVKYHLWEDSLHNTSPDPFINEKELVSKIELSDEELLKKFTFELDGKPLSEKEVKRLLAYIRADRSLEE